MASALSAIAMCDLPPSFEYAMNVPSVTIRTNAWSAVARYVVFLSSPLPLEVLMQVFTKGISDAFYCFECTRLEKDRDGCPKIINLGSSRTDLFYQKKNFRNH